jgi:hypothetical protein
MKNNLKIIRTFWNLYENDNKTIREIPTISTYDNQVVYVWGEDNQKILKDRGFDTRLVNDEVEINENNTLIRKLIALDLGLKEFGEVLMLDWDCYILRPLDDNFYEYLSSKPIQCPLYSHCLSPFESFIELDNTESKHWISFYKYVDEYIKKYNWKYNNMLVIPNFGFFYSRDITIGESLLNIAIEYKLKGLVDEIAMFIYSNCSLDDYVERYHPNVLNGVSDFMTCSKYSISKPQREFNLYIKNKIDMDIYLEHM